MKFINTETQEYPVSEYAIREIASPTTLPADITAADLTSLGFAVVQDTPMPERGEWDSVAEELPVLVDDVWTQVWTVIPGSAPVITAVPMRAARLAMIDFGMLRAVDEAIRAIPGADGERAVTEWEYSETLRRDHPMLGQLGGALGLTEELLDQLFTTAASK